MGIVHYTRRARQDLLDIWIYIEPRNSQLIADAVYDDIEKNCDLLKRHPQLGVARPEIAEDARSLFIERWLALYRITDYGVQIVRVIDQSRDLADVEWTPE
jgi:toxin ParE1/3/4